MCRDGGAGGADVFLAADGGEGGGCAFGLGEDSGFAVVEAVVGGVGVEGWPVVLAFEEGDGVGVAGAGGADGIRGDFVLGDRGDAGERRDGGGVFGGDEDVAGACEAPVFGDGAGALGEGAFGSVGVGWIGADDVVALDA